MRIATLVTIVISMMAAPSQASAQADFLKTNVAKMIRKAGIHANASFRNPVDPDATKGRTWGLSVGLSPGDTNGLRYPVALAVFSENLHSPGGPQVGVLRSRGLLAGIGYGWHFGKLSTGASLQTGFVVNRARLDANAATAFNVADGQIAIRTHNGWLLRPQVKVEYFLTRKFTVRASADYVWVSADTDIVAPGSINQSWSASNIHANVGIGIYPFHK